MGNENAERNAEICSQFTPLADWLIWILRRTGATVSTIVQWHLYKYTLSGLDIYVHLGSVHS